MSDYSVRLAHLMPLIKERLANGESVQFTPQGTSMRPLIFGGRDQVILSPLPKQLKKYDLPLYERDNGQYVLHRIVKVEENYTCIGDNQYTVETGVCHEQMIAITTAIIRNGKTYSVDHIGYKLYSRIWHISRPVRYFAFRVKRKAGHLLKKLF